MPIPRYRIYAERTDGTWEWIDSRSDKTAAFNLFDQYKRDGVERLKLVDGAIDEVLTQAVCIVRPELLVLSDGESWGLSTEPNPPPDKYLACSSEREARALREAFMNRDISPFLKAARGSVQQALSMWARLQG